MWKKCNNKSSELDFIPYKSREKAHFVTNLCDIGESRSQHVDNEALSGNSTAFTYLTLQSY
jgi:hypothetical protein